MSVNKFITYFENLEKLIVVLPGRFQPFHLGHLHIYKQLVSKFGKDKVYITTSDPKKLDDKNPLTFEQKKKLIEASGIPENKIIEMKGSAYNGEDILKSLHMNPNSGKSLIVSFSEKNHKEKKLIGKYYKKFKDIDSMNTSDKNGYIYVVNFTEKINATDIREFLKKKDLKSILKMIPNNPEYLTLLRNYFKI